MPSPAPSDRPTLAQVVEQMATRMTAAGIVFGHGTHNARDEAIWLTMWRLGLPLDGYDELASGPVSEEQLADVAAVVDERIASRKPAAYLTREAWLQGVPFFVDERCIVPRSFIAELLGDPDYGHALDAWLSDRTRQVLDLCTGNGSLAVLAAMAFPDVMVDASDLSAAALDVARINVNRHHLADRITVLESDGLADVRGPYDLILCNPPYVNARSMAALPPEFRAEPEMALAGGEDGMDFIRQLLRDAPARLSDIGVLVIEIGHERPHFEAAFPRLPAVWLETSAGADQVLLLTRDALIGPA
ncbi:50S ribosomal protein L3 N(5)-glutamine methyltransferase [Leptothrix discophora]|uniref:50S ribosomal protein L3 N(5)-glutamine methyltransferase n=1 Tax=Leptothrix discophora TaxID=89 RepID=A0ABT9FZ76_LEPDI|nr:50S ribosomal protein L3 N(5)-glutamine methyltransferase [Leptothrix discophora]MDP4299268.1 50S ribosomal protein L3 N(5)-glutamine methyltransferase [Leptothrix discophora]